MKYELKKTQLTFNETRQIVSDAVNACFDTDDNGNDINFSPEYKEPSLQCSFYENYIGLELSDDFDEAFTTYIAVNIDDIEGFNRSQWNGIRVAVAEKVEFRKQQMLNNKKSTMDEAFEALTTLLSTLNTKAEKLDPKKLNKIINNLTPESILKAYQKSNIGDDVRNNAIETLIKENKELKNQISARNVLAKPVSAKNTTTKKSVK